MPIQRQSAPVQFGQQQGQPEQVRDVSVGYVSPDRFSTRKLSAQGEGGSTRLLVDIFEKVRKYAETGFGYALEDAYVEGAAQVGQIESEEALQGDMFSRDYAVAGFRDTKARMAMADADAQMQSDMSWLRSKTPAEFNAYLNEQSSKLRPELQGMSREQRQAAMGKLMTSQYSATKTHAAKHVEYIIDVEKDSLAASAAVTFGRLDIAQKSGLAAYTAEVGNAANSLVTDIVQNTKLPRDVKQKLIKEAMEHALNSNHVLLYDAMRVLPTGEREAPYGTRADGSAKGPGFLGEIQNADGTISTELSIGVNIDGKEIEIPALVPTLTADEIEHLRQGGEVTPSIMQKAVEHAQMRTQAGQSVFAPAVQAQQRTVLGMLSTDQQGDLATKYREAQQRTSHFRALEFSDAYGKMRAVLSDQDTPLPPKEQVDAMVQYGVQQGFITSVGEMDSLPNMYYTKLLRDNDTGSLVQAFLTGDMGTILSKNKFPGDVLPTVRKTMNRQGISAPDQVDVLLTIAPTSGFAEAIYPEIGRMIGPAIGQMRQENGVMDANNAAMFSKTLAHIDKAELTGNTSAATQILAGLPEDQQSYFQYLRENLKSNNTLSSSQKLAAERMAEDSKLTPSLRASIAQAQETEDIKFAANFDYRLWFQEWKVLDPVSNKLRLVKDVFEDENRARAAMMPVRDALLVEVNAIRRVRPYMTSEKAQEMGLAAVSARTAVNAHGALVAPRGMTLNAFVGADARWNSEQIGGALQELRKPRQDSNRLGYSVAGGSIFVREYNKDGNEVGAPTELDPRAIGKHLNAKGAQEIKDADTIFGAGVTLSGININGKNNVGANPQYMLDFRKSLIKNEGVRYSAYPDGTGQSIGVGFHTKEYWPPVGPDGKVTKAGIEASLVRASDDAMRVGMRTVQKYSLNKQPALMLSAELSYQAGLRHGDITVYQDMYRAMSTGKSSDAITAFRKSKAYKVSPAPRRKHYESLIREGSNGGSVWQSLAQRFTEGQPFPMP